MTQYSYDVVDSRRGMLGMCYVLSSDLTLPRNDDIGYRNVMVVRDAVGGRRLEPRQAFDDHAQWGVCQLGASATFVRQHDREEDDGDLALFGAPGCFTWRGNVFGQSVGSLRRYDVAVNFENMRRYNKHGHMGLSVESGRFFNGRVYYVSGAPHAGEEQGCTGEIYFFEKDNVSENMLQPDVALTLTGEEFGAGFGYSLAALDANGDSVPDLLVGAPFLDGGKSGRGGAVYLYLSAGDSLQRTGAVKIIGRQLESQFGLALTVLGDLNRDGFKDFAVGAPYEEGGGTVYIFLGGPKGVASFTVSTSSTFLHAEETADQIISARDFAGVIPGVPSDLATFGSALSGGMDMDSNGHPDLVVGAYQSGLVFLLRSRPIIDISTYVDETNLKAIDPGRSGCTDDPDADEACFGFTACFSVDKEVSEQGLLMRFRIEAEPQKPVSRVWLRLKDRSTDTRSNVVNDTIRLRNGRGSGGSSATGEQRCTAVVGYVSTHADLQAPVQFALSYSLVQDDPVMEYSRGSPLPDLNDFPILNQVHAKKRFQATFEKDCGPDEVCQSQLALQPTLRDGDGELGRTFGGYYELELGSLAGSELVLQVDITNGGDPAYEAELDIYFPGDVSYIGLGQDAKLNAPDLKNDTWLHFNLGNPFKGVSEDDGEPNKQTVRLRFRPRNNIKEKLVQFFLSTNTSSEQSVDGSTFLNLMIVRRAEVKIDGRSRPAQVLYGGRVRGESALHTLSEVGPSIQHKFLVKNSGPSEVDVLTVEIGWPFQVENGKAQGKWLLYLTEHPLLRNGRGDCVLPHGHAANPLNLTPNNNNNNNRSGTVVTAAGSASLPSSKKTRREVERVIRPHVSADGLTRSVTLDCDRGTAKCLHITCQIFSLPANVSATIVVRGRLWNATLVEDYFDVDYVDILTKARVAVDPVITQDTSDDYVSVLTRAEPDVRRTGRQKQPEWWVVVAAAAVGLLLLVVISLCLWKLGFFERKRPMEEEDDTDFMLSAHFRKVKLNGS